MENVVWFQNFKVESYHTNANGLASLSSICNYLQTAAGNHAESRGFGYEDMIRKQLIWVLTRLKVRMFRYPKWYENIKIETWLRHTDGLFAQRDFIIYGHNGEKIGVALSGWVAINIKTRRPQKQKDHETLIPALNDKHAYDGKLNKVELLDDDAEQTPYKPVLFSDLDVNYHVNNVKYIEWIINTYSIDFLKTNVVDEFEINYLKETLPTDEIAIRKKQTTQRESGNEVLHTIIRKSDNKPVSAVKIFWK